MSENARDLERELAWLSALLDARLRSYFGSEAPAAPPADIPPPSLAESQSAWAALVKACELKHDERAILVLALAAHLRPQLLDVLWLKNGDTQRGFTEFGGVQSSQSGGFLPTGETAAFLLAGIDLAARFRVARMFDDDQPLARRNLVQLGPAQASNEPRLSGALVLERELVQRLMDGEPRPTFGADFPARLLRTELDWRELVLPASTLEQLEEIKRWVRHGHELLHDWDMKHKLNPGFTCLFHGPPGTGKTLSACLLGKHCGCDVYKVDLSMIVSKYIGETEKNLARVFDQAEHKRWILFFDEADSLFGKRTRVDDAHDRFANQEVSFLLQRIEEFHGVVILASNFKTNIDDAFLRRFHAVVAFPMPRQSERLRLWSEAFSARARLEPRLDLAVLAEKHEMSGGNIMNVVRYASLMALSRGDNLILLDDVQEGIRREFLKEGRSM